MSIETLIDDYCQVWSDADPARRESRLSALWAPGATYADPTVLAHDGADLLRHIERVQASRPGARVLRCTASTPTTRSPASASRSSAPTALSCGRASTWCCCRTTDSASSV